VVQRRKRRATECLQWWERVLEIRRDDLKEAMRASDVLQAMGAERTKGRPVERIIAHEVSRRPRDDDLASVRSRADPGCDVYVQAEVSVLAELGLARVDSDTYPNGRISGPRLGSERPLQIGCCPNGIPCPLEREKGTVAGPVHFVPAPLGRGRADKLARSGTHRRVALAERMNEPRGPFDVGEEQRDRPTREAAQIVTSGHVHRV
jgi:hypothetical protein